MKRIISSIMLVATFVMAFSSCQKQEIGKVVLNECKGRNRLGDDQVCLLALCYGTEDVAYSHCVCGVYCAGVE